MNTRDCTIMLNGARLTPLPSGALHWPDERALCLSDLHLGKSDRIARRTGVMLPPYETRETLSRLEADLDRTGARTVICIGDSFDDAAAADSLDEDEQLWIARLQAGRRWIWIEGNHDPGPVGLGGSHVSALSLGPLIFRHIAGAGVTGEVSGHYHPKARINARGRMVSRPCFIHDHARLILPAYGAYTGGLSWMDPAIRRLFAEDAQAVLLGDPPLPVRFAGSARRGASMSEASTASR